VTKIHRGCSGVYAVSRKQSWCGQHYRVAVSSLLSSSRSAVFLCWKRHRTLSSRTLTAVLAIVFCDPGQARESALEKEISADSQETGQVSMQTMR
jgi:hypothetical protein